jgi:hypothetical protein
LNGGTPDIKRTGDFIKAVMQDIVKEDFDMITESGYNMKELSNPIHMIVIEFLNNKLNEEIL